MDLSEEQLNQNVNVTKLRQRTYDDITSIDYIHEPIPYAKFFQRYLLANRACILGPWATDSWRSRREWVTEDDKPNLDYMLQHFGEVMCPVANCDQEEYQSHPKQEMTFADYVCYLRKHVRRSSDDDPINSAKTCSNESAECLYMKDWHFTREFSEYGAYRCPVYFSSDWLNEFWDCQKTGVDDYRFVYIGPKGSWTPFHSDVLRSYSWSANIVGCKKWIFFPPGEETSLKDKFGHLAFDLCSPDIEDPSKFPNARKARKQFEVIQRSGEVIFVPSGWHHQVFNLEDTISINHNWLNGCNIDLCWQHIVSGLHDVEREIDDCRGMDGWTEQCQLLLIANLGTDFAEFYQFLVTIAQRRMDFLDNTDLILKPSQGAPTVEIYASEEDKSTSAASSQTVSHSPIFASIGEDDVDVSPPIAYYSELTQTQALFDLQRVETVLNDMLQNPTFKVLNFSEETMEPHEFIQRLLSYLKKYDR